MSIVHITAPAQIPIQAFGEPVTPAAVGNAPTLQLFTKEAFAKPDDSVNLGTWEATPGQFRRSIVDAEFANFLSGRATFLTDAGVSYEFRPGDSAYFPPNTKGVWTVHETVRKTYVIWK
jgi:uncharacterized protein